MFFHIFQLRKVFSFFRYTYVYVCFCMCVCACVCNIDVKTIYMDKKNLIIQLTVKESYSRVFTFGSH